MLGKLFGRKKEEVVAEDFAAQKAALLDAAIEDAKAQNPVVHLKLGAQDLVERLLVSMQNERGVHVESLLAVLGSLAGFCCLHSCLKQAEALGRNTRECGIVDFETAEGERYYLGPPINALLGESNLSLLALVMGMINHLGSQDYPDFPELAKHVVGTFGKPEFGIPRIPDQHQPGDLPINYVRAIWPQTLPHIEARVPILQERVMLFGFAIQTVMEMGKDVIPPALAGRLVMECAVPMSKVDPAALWPSDDSA